MGNSKIHHVRTPEDYKDYRADRMLYEAYKQGEEIRRTHSLKELTRRMKEAGNGTLSDPASPPAEDEEESHQGLSPHGERRVG